MADANNIATLGEFVSSVGRALREALTTRYVLAAGRDL